MAENQYVIPRIVRGQDGQFYTVYVDALSGQPVDSLENKTILSAADTKASELPSPLEKSEDDKDKNISDRRLEELYPEVTRNDGGNHSPTTAGTGKKNINPIDNYGYIDKPGIVSALGVLPGALGLAGKVINGAINLGNVDSVNKGRNALGLDPLTGRQTIGSAIKGTSGQIADVDIGDKNYSVGFGALSPDGRTNLTPMEAVTRANVLGTNIKETPGAQFTDKTLTQKAAEKVDNATGGVISKGLKSIGLEKGWATKALDSVLGVDPEKSKKSETGVIGSALGLEKGWASRGLDKAFGIEREETPSKPTTTPSQTTPTPTTSTPTPTSTPNTGVGFISNFGPKRPNMPSQEITGAIQSSVMNTFGPGYSVKGISGTEGDKPQFGSKRHKTGLALDFDVIDPSGRKVTDQNALSDLAANFAYANPAAQIGYGVGYMTDENGLPGRMHFDLTDLGNVDPAHYSNQWGNIAKAEALKTTLDAARAGFQPTPFSNAPTPTARPNPPETISSLDPVGNSLDPVATQSFMSNVAQPTVARQTIANNIAQSVANTGLSPNTTPAQFAAMGLTQRTPEQIDAISRTIAGELSQRSLKGLTAGDEDATTEVANMISSIENRAQSNMFSTLDSTLNPSSYNSLMSKNAVVTNQNYNTYKDPITSAVNSFYSNQLQPSNWGITSYYNPDISNPAWGSKMANQTIAGEHLFGSLPEYSPNKGFNRMLGAYTPTPNYSGGGTSVGYGAYDTPSERNASMRMSSNQTGLGTSSGRQSSTQLGVAGAGVAGTGLGLRDTTNGGSGSGGGSRGGVASSGLNSAGNRASGAGPMSSKNTNTSSSSKSSSKSSASREAKDSRSSTRSGSVGKGGHNAD